MAQLIFPANPTDGQTYTGGNGVTYTYKSPPGVWGASSDGGGRPEGASIMPADFTIINYDARSGIWTCGQKVTLYRETVNGALACGPFTAATSTNGLDWVLYDGGEPYIGSIWNVGGLINATTTTQALFVGVQNKAVYIPGRSPSKVTYDGIGGSTFSNNVRLYSSTVSGQSSSSASLIDSYGSKSGPGGRCVAYGPVNGSANAIVSTDDDFETVTTVTGGGLGSRCIYLPNINRWFVGSSSGFSYSTDGLAFSSSTGMPSQNGVSICENSTGGILVASNTTDSVKYVSTNGGASYTAASTPVNLSRSVWFTNGAFWAVGTQDNILYKSTNGTTWNQTSVNIFDIYGQTVLGALQYPWQVATDGKRVLMSLQRGLYDIPSSYFN